MRSLNLLLTSAALVASTCASVPTASATTAVGDARAGNAAAASPAAPTPASNPDPVTPEEAIDLLDEVDDLLTPDPSGRSGQAPTAPIDRSEDELTTKLLQLAQAQDQLPPAKRREAERILARPSDGNMADQDGYEFPKDQAKDCSGPVCVHWATNPEDSHYAAPATGNAYTDEVVDSMSTVYNKYVDMGYRTPVSDQGADGTAKSDIYLADLGGTNSYGYCTSDDPKLTSNYDHRGTYGYCVYDNDYRDPVYGKDYTPIENLRVTAAHEYFHLLQFGYDFGEDLWLLEATATWAEEQVYPAINGNNIYLQASPITRPRTPVVSSDIWYGSWVFFQYLSQRFGPEIVREIWERVDAWRAWGTRNPPNEYSLQAVRGAVAKRTSWNDVWRRFVDHNRRPSGFYADAKSGEAKYPYARPYASQGLSWRTKSDRRSGKLDHLTGSTLRYYPTKGTTGDWRMKVSVAGLGRANGGSGIATYQGNDGGIRRVPFDFRADGTITKWLPFGLSKMKWVDITVVNASTRYNCGTNDFGDETPCQGNSRDDNRAFEVKVSISKK